MQFSRVPRFIPLWLKQTTVSLFAHLKAGFVDDPGSLRGKHVVNFLTCFCSLWGHQKKPVEIIPSSYLGIQAWKGLENIVLALKRRVTASGTRRVEITCPGGVELCFWFVLEEKTHTWTGKWTLIKYCLCYLLFLRNTSNWWDLLKTWTLGRVKKIMP